MSTAYLFHLNFAPTSGTEKPISNDAKRRIIDALARVDPRPRDCSFDCKFKGYRRETLIYSNQVGHFYVTFGVKAESPFEASQLAMGVCEQVTKLALSEFEFTISAISPD